jgi:LemA protein
MTNQTVTQPEDWLAKNWKRLALWTVAGALVVIAWGSYNGLVSKSVAVQEASANVSTLYQRRANLIPNLVQTVQAAGFNERDTLTQVQEARSKATAITIDASKASPEQLQRMQEAQGQLAAALGKLMMVREAYPDLKTNQNFLNLQSQIEGSENRIQVALQRYNGVCGDMNRSLLVFPSNIVNGALAHLQPCAMFREQEGTETPPAVNFKRN